MSMQVFVNFNGNCREAVNFYSEVFKVKEPEFMTFADMPGGPDYSISEKTKGLIVYTSLRIEGGIIMFSDATPEMPLIIGNNVSLTIVSKDMDEIKRLFKSMKEGGTVTMELQETFWSKCYGNVTDKFGIQWQFSHDSGLM
jgi:PhnB protein